MESKWYSEYKMVPCGKPGLEDIGDEFIVTLGLLRMLDMIGFMQVNPDHSACEHNRVRILIDGVHYDEHILMWNRRFE